MNQLFITSFSQFENTWVTSVTDNLTLLDLESYEYTVKNTDDSNNPIVDSLVRIHLSDPSRSSEYKKIGQAFTGESGMFSFYIQNNSDISTMCSADSYNTNEKVEPVDLNQFLLTNPNIFVLDKSLTTVNRGVIFRLCQSYNNLTNKIPISLMALMRSTAYYNTSFKSATTPIDLGDEFFGESTLKIGDHYCSDCTDSLIIYLYLDEELFANYTIPYIEFEDINEEPSGLDYDILFKLIWILVIISIGVFGILFKTNEEMIGTGGFGKGLLLIACFLIPLLFGGRFIVLLIIASLYGVGMLLKKWISE